MIRLVAFDMDGTIGDTVPMCLDVFQKAVAPYVHGEVTEETIRKTFGLNEESMMRQIVGDRWQDALSHFHALYRQMHYLCPALFEGIRELIADLRERNIRMALVTGKGLQTCSVTLEQFGLGQYFDTVLTGGITKNLKADHMRELLVRYRLQPQEMVYVGDELSDYKLYKEVGVECLSAAWAVHSPAEKNLLEQENEGSVFYSVASLHAYLIENTPTFDTCKCGSPNPPWIPQPQGWQQTTQKDSIDGMKKLTEQSFCQCAKGGRISFSDTGANTFVESK